jgi:hypothetical protein
MVRRATFRVFLIRGREPLNLRPVLDLLMLKVLHLAGVFALFASLGATMLAGSKGKAGSMLHGISLVLILLVGFAMLKKPPMDQNWWMAKLGLWLLIGGTPVLAKRKVLAPWMVFALCLVAASAAAYIGISKPF